MSNGSRSFGSSNILDRFASRLSAALSSSDPPLAPIPSLWRFNFRSSATGSVIASSGCCPLLRALLRVPPFPLIIGCSMSEDFSFSFSFPFSLALFSLYSALLFLSLPAILSHSTLNPGSKSWMLTSVAVSIAWAL